MTTTATRTPQVKDHAPTNMPIRRDLPLFLTLDKEKILHLKALYETGHKVRIIVKKEDKFPTRVFGRLNEICETAEDLEMMLRINERLLDKRIIVNVADFLDDAVKKAIEERPDLKNGIAILNDFTYTFSELDNIGGTHRDIKKALKRTVAAAESCTNCHSHTLGSVMTPYLPIPFEGSKLDYGTWGRPALVDEHIERHKIELTASFLNVKMIKRFSVSDKPRKGFWYKDLTDDVQNRVAESGIKDGYAIVTTMHTTIGMIKMDPSRMPELHRDLLEIAPEDPSLYYHNKLVRKGELELREDNGKPLGDGNGQSHVMASLIGFYTVVSFRNGRIQLSGNERVLHIDCDTQPPRERGVVMSFIDTGNLE